jgi:hypothetical protein
LPVHVKIGVRSQESGVRSQEKKEKEEEKEESIFYGYILHLHLNIYQVLTLTLQVFHFLLYI